MTAETRPWTDQERAALSALPTVQQAWANVMAELRAVGKDQRNSHQGFNFRGVDDVMNAVGPALRKHGVSVVPTSVDLRTRDAQTTQGKAAHETTVVVGYTIHGPAGDSMPGASAGESLDSGDKATPKAMSVAYRTFLLQALCLPTNEVDPDAQSYDRAPAAPAPSRAEMAAQAAAALRDAATAEDVRLWMGRIEAHQLGDMPVADTGTGAETLAQYAAARLTACTPNGVPA